MNFLWVGIGGMLGGLCRYYIGKQIAKRNTSGLPFGTLLINLSGAFLLGVLTGVTPEGRAYLLLGDGFCGAYTTFSTFMFEGFNLFKGKKRMNALVYIIGTMFLGVLAYVAGFLWLE